MIPNNRLVVLVLAGLWLVLPSGSCVTIHTTSSHAGGSATATATATSSGGGGTTTTTITTSTTTSDRSPVSVFVRHHRESDEMLRLALEESANSIIRPENFVDDEMSIDEIVKLFENLASTTEAQIETTTLDPNLVAADDQAESEPKENENTKQVVDHNVAVDTEPVIESEPVAPIGPEPCPICLDDLTKETDFYKLNCGHDFHGKCLGDWFHKMQSQRQAVRCPMCNTAVIRTDEERNSRP